MARIAFADKNDVRISLEAAANKVSAADMNEIKSSVNAIYDSTIAGTLGWVQFSQNSTPFNVGTTPVRLSVDGSNGQNVAYKPASAVGNLWNTVSNLIEPELVGDAYMVRVSLTVSAKVSNPNYVELVIDIGGGPTITNVAAAVDAPVYKNAPFEVNFSLPIYTLATFKANGGALWLSTDTGSLSIIETTIFIARIYSPEAI